MRALLLVLALAAGQDDPAGVVVKGSVTTEGAPLPGCTVTLTSGTVARRTVSDANGLYGFRYAPPGHYDLTIELSGFQKDTRPVEIRGETLVPAVELRPLVDMITVTCNLHVTCSPEPPSTPFDPPLCADEELHNALIEAAGRGDRSAVGLLRQRYQTANSYREKQRLAAALLGKVSDDRAIWSELHEQAALAVRFPTVDGEYSAEFEEYCRARSEDPVQLWDRAYNALERAGADPRSRPLLYEALKTSDRNLVYAAIWGLATQRDDTALPAIEEAFQRFENLGSEVVLCLALFRSEAADALAMKYLDESSRADYDTVRFSELR